MIPTVHDELSTNFSSIGLGGLDKTTACRVIRQLNGVYELEMSYPVIGRRFRDLRVRNIIVASVDPDSNYQPFRIYKTRMDLMLKKHVYARHIAYDLMGCPVSSVSGATVSAAMSAMSAAVSELGFRFNFSADFYSGARWDITAPRSAWAAMGGQQGSLLDVYGGEWEFDQFDLTLRKEIGEDRGMLVRYGKNLTKLQQDDDDSGTWTAVYPYWLSQDGTQLVTLPSRIVSTGYFPYNKILVWDASAEFIEPPTELQLLSRTERYIADNKLGDLSVSIDAEWVPLEQTEEYNGRGAITPVHLGDTVYIEYPTAADHKTGRPIDYVRTASRVVEYAWLPMQDRYEYVRVGSKRANFAAVVAQATKNINMMLNKVR